MSKENVDELTFRQRVYDALKKVPAGKVTTYKDLAEHLGGKGYRVVGTALKKNPYAPVVPCHRVIKSNGHIGLFQTGTDKKIELLKKEGIEIIDGKIDLKKFGFDFSE
eukprot:gene11890-5217_t